MNKIKQDMDEKKQPAHMQVVVNSNETKIFDSTTNQEEASEEENPEEEKMNRSPSHRGIEAGERLYAKAKISESKKKEKIEEKERL
jgi:hypothetical protein